MKQNGKILKYLFEIIESEKKKGYRNGFRTTKAI